MNLNFNQEKADSAIKNYKKTIFEITTDVNEKLLEREVWYNKTNMLTIANAFYILSFLLICISWIFKPGRDSPTISHNYLRTCSVQG